MKQEVYDLIRQFKHYDAFWAVAENVEEDAECQRIFQLILGITDFVCELEGDLEQIKQQADQGNPYMAYAYARYMDIISPDSNSIDNAYDYYTRAQEGGVPDAYARLAAMFRDGDLGEVDLRKYEELLNEGIEHESSAAAYFMLLDMVYGNNNAIADPKRAYEMAENFTKTGDFHYGRFYIIMGKADEELGRYANASNNFELATQYGFAEGYYWQALSECMDPRTGEIVDEDRFGELTELGEENGSSSASIAYLLIVSEEEYQSFSQENQKQVHEAVEYVLNTAIEKGNGMAAYFLGLNYEGGYCGYEKDAEKAFSCYTKGAILHDNNASRAAARMILEDHTAPEEYSEDFGYELLYRALQLGNDCLRDVIAAYCSGHLTEHAAMIESTYLPMFHKLPKEDDNESYEYDDDDDAYNDDHEYLYDGEQEVGEDDWSAPAKE